MTAVRRSFGACERDMSKVDKKNVVLGTLKVEYFPVDAIKPNDYNPNRQSTHDFEMLCKSIAADGFTQPIVVLRETMQIVDGEHRWRACKALGHKEVPAVLTDMTPEQARIATLRHNRARGTEDAALAADVLKDLAALGAADFAQEELALDDAEMQRLLGDMPEDELKGLEIPDVGEDQLGPTGAGLTDTDREHHTDTTADQRRAKEKILAGAKKQEESDMKQADRVYKLVTVYTDKEAELVKRVLGADAGNYPAAILELCRQEQKRLEDQP